MAGFDLDRAVPLIREAAFVSASAATQVFAHENGFVTIILGQMLQQASLLEGRDYTATGPDLPVVAEEVILPDLPGDGLIVFAACCETYFLAYGERFIRGLVAVCSNASCLIHVMNPDAAGDAARAGLRNEFPRTGFSTETGPTSGGWYASRRFLLCPVVQEHYRRDLVVMDVDSVFDQRFTALLDASAGSELAYIGNSQQCLPSLLVSAAYLFHKAGSMVAARFAQANAN
ncbi:MAG: hypothetical protein WCF85_21850 [Rhodospirillaceae bacterium]